MLRIALCDDELDARDALRIQLEQLLLEDIEEIVYEFSSGTSAASWFQKHPGEIDLLFLDIEMRGLNGMETAVKIRQFDENLTIVFVTGYADYVFEGYQVDALDYLLKPVSNQKLSELLRRVRTRLYQQEEQSFLLKNMDGTWRFHFRDILYFYSDRRRVILAAKSGEYPFYEKLDAIESQLAPHFIRIHQRSLITPANVDLIGKESVRIGTAKLPCSRKYRETATIKIAKAMMGGSVK